MTQIGLPHRRQPLKGNSAESLRFRGQLATNIKRAASAKSWPLTELAKHAGMTYDRVYAIAESTAGTQAIELCVLAKTLGVNVDELVKGCV